MEIFTIEDAMCSLSIGRRTDMPKDDDPIQKILSMDPYSQYSGLLSMTNLPVVLVDTDGNLLFEFIPTPDFCRYVCQKDPKGICEQCVESMKGDKSGHYVCKYGLVNTLFPIYWHDKLICYVYGTQAYTHETEYQKYMINIPDIAREKGMDVTTAAKMLAAINTVNDDRLQMHKRLCSHIAQNISFSCNISDSGESDAEMPEQAIEREMLEKKIIDLEAKNMSLAVNPHFLFNTLNCMARIAYFENATKTEELIYCLSDLLRYNLRKGDQLHTIGAELDNVEKYLQIQKIRFGDRLEYSVDVSDYIRSRHIPNMTLQPIVENSMVHGIAPRRDGGMIHIYAEKSKKKIVIYVSDNGNGFPKEVLENLRSNKPGGLGYQNTDKRLKRYYGEGFGLEVVKSDYSGSTVAIKIPEEIVVR